MPHVGLTGLSDLGGPMLTPLLMEEEPDAQRGTMASSPSVAEQGFGPSFPGLTQCCPLDRHLEQRHPVVLTFETTSSGGTFWKGRTVLYSGLPSMAAVSHVGCLASNRKVVC